MISKILCIGNNSEDTDIKVSALAKAQSTQNFGLILDPAFVPDLPGYYHSSIYDLEVGELLKLVKNFNQLVFLDQPKEEWTHPDAFYRSVQVVKEIEKTTPVKWQNLSASLDIDFFENLVETNKSFCIFPFIELLVQNGHTTVCCRSDTKVTTLPELTNWQTNPAYKKIREKMLAGEIVPEHCNTCYLYEARGMRSARQQETIEWANRLNLKTIEDVTNINTPKYYEVRPNNICNLQCRTCGPSSSNLIEKEYNKLGWIPSTQTITYENFNFIKLDTLKKLYVAGGEPTAMPELYEFLQNCIDNNIVDFEFLINTNAVKINNKLKTLFDKFNNLQFIISIDGFKEVNHYVRWPSDWDSIINNAHYLQEHNHKIAFNVVVSIWTVSRLHQLLEFIDKEFPKVVVHATIAESSEELFSPFNFVNKTLFDDLIKITELNCYRNDRLLKSFVDGLIAQFKQPQSINKQRLIKFFEFNDKLDQSRNVQLKDYIPELDSLRKLVYN